MPNSKNTLNSKNISIMEQVWKILKLGKEDVKNLIEKERRQWIKETICSILENNSDNRELVVFLLENYKENIFSLISENLKKDKQVIVLSIRKDYKIFFTMDEKFREDLDLWYEFIKSFIINNWDFSYFEKILEKHCKTKKYIEILMDFYIFYLRTKENLKLDDLSKWMIFIRKNNKIFYDFLAKEKIISSAWNKYYINSNFINIFFENLDNYKIYEDFSPEDKIIYKKNYLWKLLNIDIQTMDSDSLFVFEIILDLLWTEENKRNFLKKKKKIDKKEETIDKDKELKYEYNSDKVDYCLWVYEYSTDKYGNYHISVESNKVLQIPKKELERFTSEWLKNFVKFYNMLCDLQLNFLWDKHKTQFINILNNKIWFSYPDWKWVTESRALQILNLILKAIWIVWQLDKNTFVKDFKTLDSAKLPFKDLKNTWKIWNTVYSNFWMHENPPVEQALKVRWYINKDNELSTNKFYEI